LISRSKATAMARMLALLIAAAATGTEVQARGGHGGGMMAVNPSTPWTPGGGFRPDCCCPRWSIGADTVSVTCAWSPCCGGLPGIDPGAYNPRNWIQSFRNGANFGFKKRHRMLLEDDEGCESVVDAVVNSPDLSMLLQAVQATGLSDALMAGPLTVFAPTNKAIENAMQEHMAGATLEALAEDAVDVLASILKYHVLAAPVFSSNLTDDGVATSLLTNSEGTAVPLIVTLMDGVPNEMIPNAMENVTDGSIYVNNAKITGPDVAVCSDGSVIHLIDTVLLPPLVAEGADAPSFDEADALQRGRLDTRVGVNFNTGATWQRNQGNDGIMPGR